MKHKEKQLIGNLLSLPAFTLIFIVLILPLGYAVYYSLLDCNFMQITGFVGLKNYIDFFSSEIMIKDLIRTFILSFASLSISLITGLLLALWIHSSKSLFAYILQIIGLIPWVTSMVVAALLWQWILQTDTGLLNYVLSLVGLKKIIILNNKTYAFIALILVVAWRCVGYAMVQVLAGLKSIPVELEAAGKVDGCSNFQIFRYIRLPLIKTPLLLSTIIITLSNFNNLTVPQVLTNGGPGTSTRVLSLAMYQEAFHFYRFGFSSTIACLMFMINLLLVVGYVKAVKYEL